MTSQSVVLRNHALQNGVLAWPLDEEGQVLFNYRAHGDATDQLGSVGPVTGGH
jgi:hypothetical protein